ncbi:hypothetical protein Y032_0060g3183 [Ancylostoma ceylanicum]|uniref:Uncharacterized protein n=1 Tax=Ancylostoma ceylanicum TaxID=53326 RepID=A0A016U2S0_9BILA|nr:hypothetical protein Y032_0060g3183 [Ancylostoma ceylanicum]
MAEARLRWYGHTLRSDNSSVAKSAMNIAVDGRGPRVILHVERDDYESGAHCGRGVAAPTKVGDGRSTTLASERHLYWWPTLTIVGNCDNDANQS